MKAEGLRRGRPTLTRGEAKRASFNTRLRSTLKNRLEEEGRQAGRSLSEEIEMRLENSLRDEGSLDQAMTLAYGPAMAVALAIVARTVLEIGRHAPFPQTWTDRGDMVDAGSWAAAVVFASFAPGEYPPPPPPLGSMAENIAGSLLHAVKDPEHGAPELRAWAEPLHSKCPEIASRLRFPPYLQHQIAADGVITAQRHDGDTVTPLELTEIKPGQTVHGITVRVKPPGGDEPQRQTP